MRSHGLHSLLGALLLDSGMLRLGREIERNKPAPPPPYDLRLIQPQPETRQQRRARERKERKVKP